MKRKQLLIVLIALGMCLAGCGPSRLGEGAPEATERQQAGLVEVTLMLDWVPNTNHTGIFMAESKGYFEQVGLDVEIIQPGEVYAEQAVVGGAADFGVSFQEQLTMARADGAELVSIAAIIQHNTSGFASRAEQGVETPADWEGLRYGSFGSPFEQPTLSVLMQCAGGDFEQLEIVDTGFADPLALLDEQQTDLAWIFYAWQGVQAQLAGIELNVVMMEDWFDCIPDYYTPIFITSQQTIDEQPEIVAAFLDAISRGYEDAIGDPEEAADILLQAVPEMSEELVRTSQDWISPRYQADAPRWGEQSLSVWQEYADWMLAHGIITVQLDASQAFTNQFLPAR